MRCVRGNIDAAQQTHSPGEEAAPSLNYFKAASVARADDARARDGEPQLPASPT